MEESKFILEKMFFSDLKKSITLPTFQKNLVWTQDKKVSFIRTIMNGYPFGSFLLYRENPEKFLLVDGLQRYSTLIEFSKNPLSFVKIYDICKELIDELVIVLRSRGLLIHSSSISKEKVISVISSNIDFKEKVNRHSSIVTKILTELSNDNSDKLIDMQYLIFDLVDEVKKAVDITNLSIPYILFTGEYEVLSNIYEELNSNGTSLTKYEVYAAKYLSMQENSNIEIKNYSEGIILEQKKINLFEYCYAYRKNITRRM